MPSGSAPLLQVTVRRAGPLAVLHLDGELDCSTAPQLTGVLRELLRGGEPPGQVLVDVGGVSFADVSGLDPLIDVARRLGPGAVRLRHPSRQVRRVTALLHLDGLLGIDP